MQHKLIFKFKRFVRPFLNRFFRFNKLPFKYKYFNFINLKKGNRLYISPLSSLKRCKINFGGRDGEIMIADFCQLENVDIIVGGSNSKVIINEKTTINGKHFFPSIIYSYGGKQIKIGKDCMISWGVQIQNTDYHPIINSYGEIINKGEDVIIRDHVWIGLNSVLLKGTEIATNNIIAANSLCNKKYPLTNTIIAGNPARVKKDNINWKRQF